MLAAAAHDEARVGLLVRRVVGQADRMEGEHFEDRRDQKLDVFELDLRDVGSDDV